MHSLQPSEAGSKGVPGEGEDNVDDRQMTVDDGEKPDDGEHLDPVMLAKGL